MSYGWIYSIFRYVAFYSEIIIVTYFFRKAAALLFHLVRGLLGSYYYLSYSSHGLTIRGNN